MIESTRDLLLWRPEFGRPAVQRIGFDAAAQPGTRTRANAANPKSAGR